MSKSPTPQKYLPYRNIIYKQIPNLNKNIMSLFHMQWIRPKKNVPRHRFKNSLSHKNHVGTYIKTKIA